MVLCCAQEADRQHSASAVNSPAAAARVHVQPAGNTNKFGEICMFQMYHQMAAPVVSAAVNK